MPGRHRKGSKGVVGGYGGYRRRKRWPDRMGSMETPAERAERQRLIEAFVARGGRIKRYPLAIAYGLAPARTRELGLDQGDALDLLPA